MFLKYLPCAHCCVVAGGPRVRKVGLPSYRVQSSKRQAIAASHDRTALWWRRPATEACPTRLPKGSDIHARTWKVRKSQPGRKGGKKFPAEQSMLASCWRAREEINMPGCRDIGGGRKEAGELGKGSSYRVTLRGLDSIVWVIGNTETRYMMRFML